MRIQDKLMALAIFLLLFSCGEKSASTGVLVKNSDELRQALSEVGPGSEIVIANGIYKDVQMKLYGLGTENKPITLRAETPGKVFFEGQSNLHLGGEYLVVNGLYFRNGYSPEKGIIRFKIGNDSIANNSRVTSCVIDGFTRPNRWENDRWVEFYGKHNQLDHSYIAGKSNDGVTLMVYHTGNENTNNHHQIVNNYFGPRPRKGGPRAETLRTGGSETSMTPGYVNVSNNFFEACNGEVEIISDKTNFNSFTNNIFYKCEGSLVLRHADYATVDGNIFIGGDDSNFYGGIRLVNTGHWITNNYFYKIRGEEFRSPLAVMNGIPKSSLNRYKQVTDAVVAYNTWVDCLSPWQIGVGQNKASADVLPSSEIRSAPPVRTTIANNFIYNTKADKSPVVNHDDINGILFKNNILDNYGSAFNQFESLHNEEVKVKQLNEWLFVPEEGQDDILAEVFDGYDFKRIEKDLFGSSRGDKNRVGAIADLSTANSYEIDRTKYGPEWFSPSKEASEPNLLSATSAEGELQNVIAQAKDGDVVELSDEVYKLKTSLKIDKNITIRSKSNDKVQLVYEGKENTAAFQMNPKGVLHMNNVTLTGQENQLAFAPLEKNMSSAYNLNIENCVIENFEYVLKATTGSFADSLDFKNSLIQNCKNGFVLAAEEKGNYNAEMVTFDSCEFKNVDQNVIYFYRGGYDESTIGGYLTVKNSTFTASGSSDKSSTLIKTPGIINVNLEDNTFQNNQVKLVALLWGAKNNTHSGNEISNSGKIEVQQNIELKLLY